LDAPRAGAATAALVGDHAQAKRIAQSLHIPSLDGLRAVSFFVVFFAHAATTAFPIPGGFGVTVFFFLSGYLITTLLRLEMEGAGQVSFRHFYLRRVLRILPPFYITLALATLLSAIGYGTGPLAPSAVVAQALHYYNFWAAHHTWVGVAGGTGVLWSLAVEEHFYFAFPALFVLLWKAGLRERRMALVFWAICAAVLAWRCVLVYVLHAPSDRTFIMTDTRVDSILFGCALAVWKNPAIDDVDVPPSPLWLRLFLPLGLGGLLIAFVVRSDAFRESFRYSLQGISLYPIFVTAIRYPKWGPFRSLNLGAVRHLGVLSYSLYLGHHVVIDLVNRHVTASAFVRTTVALFFALLYAEAMYRFVEKPCAKLRRRFSRVG
jgi:peptidoglycan/LPS O-acetylase OafA/YrhL